MRTSPGRSRERIFQCDRTETAAIHRARMAAKCPAKWLDGRYGCRQKHLHANLSRRLPLLPDGYAREVSTVRKNRSGSPAPEPAPECQPAAARRVNFEG